MKRFRKKTNNIIRSKEREFYVVQFIESPFEDIDDYVCVPCTWIVVRRAKDPEEKAAVVYPVDEDPSVTKDRVKRKERHKDYWKCFIAAVKYESDTQPRIPNNENQVTKCTQTEEVATTFICNERIEQRTETQRTEKNKQAGTQHTGNIKHQSCPLGNLAVTFHEFQHVYSALFNFQLLGTGLRRRIVHHVDQVLVGGLHMFFENLLCSCTSQNIHVNRLTKIILKKTCSGNPKRV